MATSTISLKKKIETLKKGLNNKFISASQKEKIKSQVEKLEKQVIASKPTKAPISSSLSRLQKLVNKKKYGVYSGAGVDLKKDAGIPAKAIGKRKAKSGNTYYEYRANRIDVKQPSKKAPYPKLADGGMMAKGGEVGNFRFEKGDLVYAFQFASDKNGKLRKDIDLKYVVGNEKDHNLQKFAKVEIVEQYSDEKYWETYKAKLIDGHYNGFDGKIKKGEIFVVSQGQLSKSNKRPISMDIMDEIIKAEKEDGYMAKGGFVSKGELVWRKLSDSKKMKFLHENFTPQITPRSQEILVGKDFQFLPKDVKIKLEAKYANVEEYANGGHVQGYDDKEDERLGMKDGKMSSKDLDSTHARRDDARFEERMADGGKLKGGDEVNVLHKGKNAQEIWDNLSFTTRAKVLQHLYMGEDGDNAQIYEYYNSINELSYSDWDKLPKNIKNEVENFTKVGYMANGGETQNKQELISQLGKTLEKANELMMQIFPDTQEEFDKLPLWTRENLVACRKAIYEAMSHRFMSSFENGGKLNENDTDDYARKVYKPVGVNSVAEKQVGAFKEGARYANKIFADGGISDKEVAESNAEMVLSQIKAVKHHAEELSRVVSTKSNIEAWVVGKIERASTDLSDITHYLDGNKDKMSMGGSVRYYSHKMDK